MAGDKTISIDLSLFSGGKSRSNRGGSSSDDGSGGSRHNKTLRKERKVRPKLSGPSPNSLRKNLLAKIKEHQQKENVESKRRNLLDDGNRSNNNKQSQPTPSGNTSYGSLDGDMFEDEFTRSLAYLSALAKSKENVRAEKKAKAKLKFKTSGAAMPLASSKQPQEHASQSIMNSNPVSHIVHHSSHKSAHQTLRRMPDKPFGMENRHQNNGSTRVPEISLEMPPELDDTPKVEIQVLPSLSSHMTQPNHLFQPQPQPQPQPQTQTHKISQQQPQQQPQPQPQPQPQQQPQVHIRNDPPYGVLKGGSKPTYRDYSRTQKNPSSHNNQQNHSRPTQNYPTHNVVSVNEHLIRQKQERDKDKTISPLVIPSSGNGNNDDGKRQKPRRSKTVKRTTRTRHFKLGKDAKRRVISVFIKNNTTRRRIKLEIGQLKRVPIKDVKSYLRKHNLLKVGSSAPNDVLRHMYEQSVLSGDVNNLAKDTLIHNFLNDRQLE